MRRHRTLWAAAGLAIGAALAGPSTVSAAKPYDPNVARVANPANVCRSIPGSIPLLAAKFGAPAPDLSWFNYSECVRTLAAGKAFVEGEGSPYEQCDFLVGVGAFAYPVTLHSGEEPEVDDVLPDLTVRNRKECGNALYAYHTIFTALGPPPG
jgi:hypothetical protein